MKQPFLGKKIAEVRRKNNYTQDELAQISNINVRTIQRIESGEVTPRSFTLRTIFDKLNYAFDNKSDNELQENEEESLIDSSPSRKSWIGKYGSVLYFFLKILGVVVISLLLVYTFKFFYTIESRAKIEKVKMPEKTANSPLNVRMTFTSFSCDGCFEDENEIVGRDVKLKIKGVTINAALIKINKENGAFKTCYFDGFLLDKRVNATIDASLLYDNLVSYSASKIENKDGKIYLKGKAKVISIKNEKIEADEILLTKIGN